MAALLELQSLEIGYPISKVRRQALVPAVNLEVRQGDFIALSGANGTGKSTLLKTIAGIIPALGGKILLQNKPLQSYSAAEKALLVSIVLTEYPEDQFLHAEDVVAMGRYPHLGFWGIMRANDRRIVAQSMEACGISHLKGRRLVSLSDGERQKTMIAKALAQDSPLIILDEPSAFLDYPGKIELMQLLKQLVKTSNKAIVFSSHDLDLVLRSVDQLWLMAKGRPLVAGKPEELVLSGQINSYFDRNGLSFDQVLGHFIPERKNGPLVYVEGQILQTKWLKNALLRDGFRLSLHPGEELQVVCDTENFTIRYKGKAYICSTIDSVIQKLMQLCVNENSSS